MLKIYNSISREKQEFIPLTPKVVNLYVCGVTVYDYCHIGHARTYMFFDTVVRYFNFLGFKVNFIRNITDVDDKILNKAKQHKVLPDLIAKQFTEEMQIDFAALNLLIPEYEPKATEYIEIMIKLINKLLINNYAYIGTNGDVFYNTKNFKNYGSLAKRDLENMQHTDRVEEEVQVAKLNLQDFVLWKLVVKEELGWNSPWGYGRPGWHTECAAMSLELFGNEFDIHGGGADLIFPHHENEVAQIEGIVGKRVVNYWMHVGFLQVNQQKMSKSLGNFTLIREILAVYPAEVLRCFMLSSHYRSQIEFTEDKLQVAKLSLERLYLSIRGINLEINLGSQEEHEFNLKINNYYLEKFTSAMEDDFNTPLVLSILFELSKELNILKENDKEKNKVSIKAQIMANLLIKIANIIGLLIEDPEEFFCQSSKNFKTNSNVISTQEIKELITKRNLARKAKDWQLADLIRQNLAKQGILLEDQGEQTTWRRG